MKNKVFGVAAASTSAVTAAIFWAPAHAQIVTAPQNFNVTVSVPEVLYLRTAQNINISLSAVDLNTSAPAIRVGSGSAISEVSPTTANSNNTGGVSLATPFSGTTGNAINVSKSVPQAYAVWSNSPRNQGIRVTTRISNSNLSGPQGSSGTITKVTTTLNNSTAEQVNAPAPGLVTPASGSVNLDINLGGTQTAGDYTGGVITIQAEAP